MNASRILIGAGGHARVVFDALSAQGLKLTGYADPKQAPWLEQKGHRRISEEELATLLPTHPELVMGFVGLDCAALQKRYGVMQEYLSKGAVFPAIIHPSATVSDHVELAPGVQILPGAVVNHGARIGQGAIINSAAVVEHDAVIGAGVHIAPRSVVLGGAVVGDLSYIGSGAVVIQGSEVPASAFVKALSVHN